MKIRKLQAEDVEAYWKLRLQALYEYPQAFGASYEEAKDTPMENVRERFSSSNSNFILGAYTELDELVGMVGFRQEIFAKMRHKGTVWGMYVEERHQRQGLGKRLMQALIHLAGQIPGLEQIRLYVVDTNESARQLYRSMGFATYGLEIHAMKLNETTYVNEELMVYRMPKREETTTVEKSALLVIDVQEGMFDEAYPVYAGDGLLKQIQLLIAKARSSGAPVIYVQHNEGPGEPLATHTPAWKIHSAIAPAEDDVIVQKHTPDSFHRTNLQDELTKLGVRRLVLTGMQTEMCIDTTCRRAVSLGYDVVLAQDAHSTWSSEQLTAEQIIEHHNQVLRWFAKMENSADIAF